MPIMVTKAGEEEEKSSSENLTKESLKKNFFQILIMKSYKKTFLTKVHKDLIKKSI